MRVNLDDGGCVGVPRNNDNQYSFVMDGSQGGIVHDGVSSRFLDDVRNAIELRDKLHDRPSSKTYKPSSLACERQMFFMRTGRPRDTFPSTYSGLGMADTGTRRHVAIQEVLEEMSSMGFPWEYVDVGEYIEEKHREGRILETTVTHKRGHEYHLINDRYHVSFMCDGILRHLDTGERYLFEFKNQISMSAQRRQKIDPKHIPQITAYSALLDLDNVIMLYENRDNCELLCPAVYNVTDDAKRELFEKLDRVEGMTEKGVVPKADKGPSCKYCAYAGYCKKLGGATCIDLSE